MASLSCFLVLISIIITLSSSFLLQPPTSVAENALDSLDLLGCSKFKSLIQEAELERKYTSAQPLTLFVFNDTAYELYRNILDFDSMNATMARRSMTADYVETFTLSEVLKTSSFSALTPKRTDSKKGLVLFLNSRRLRVGNVASGQLEPTQYFCNGARIVRPNIEVGQHVIHIIDKVLPLPVRSNVLSYISGRAQANNWLTYKFYKEFMQYLDAHSFEGEFSYSRQINLPLLGDQVTFFIPSDEAVSKIPSQKLSDLKVNRTLLLEIIALHIIPNKVLYTSLVNHNESFVTQMGSGRITFRKTFNKEAVYVTGSLRRGDSVTARVFPANVTVQNGVVHQIDRILGFTYKTALQEISADQVTK